MGQIFPVDFYIFCALLCSHFMAKKSHELKVRDIKAIPEGIRNYVKFDKSNEIENTYYYFINRKGEDNPKKARIKTIFVAHRLK